MDGNVMLSTDLDTRPVTQSLSNLKKKIVEVFKGADVGTLQAGLKEITAEIKATEAQAKKAQAALDALMSGEKVPVELKDMQAQIKDVEKELSIAQKHLDDLMSGRKEPETVKRLTEQLKEAEREYAELTKRSQELIAAEEKDAAIRSRRRSRQTPMTDEQLAGLKADLHATNEAANNTLGRINDLKSAIQAVRMNPELSAETRKYQAEVAALEHKLEELREVEMWVKQNPQLTAEAKAYQEQIKEIENRLTRLREKQDEYTTAVERSNIRSQIASKSMVVGLQKIEHRIGRLAKRVLFFSLITMALRNFRKYVTALINSDDALSASLAQVKGNLATAFGSIWSSIVPALRVLIGWLAKATAYLAAFISWLTGKSFKQGQQAFESASNASAGVASNTGKIGKAAKKAAKEAQRLLLPFDEMNVLSKESADDGTGAGGSGGTGGGAGAGGITWPKEMDKVMAKFEKFKDLILLIGAAFAAWKLSKVASALLGISRIKAFVGLTALIAGIALLVTNIRDLIKNGPNVENVCGIIAGGLLTIGGAVMLLTGATGIGLIIIAIGLLVLAFRNLYKQFAPFRKYVDNAIKSIKKAFGKGKLAGFKEIGKQIILGILNGIVWVVKKLGSWVKKHVVTPFKKWFKKRFGIHSPAKEMLDIGKDIMLGVLNGITIPIKKIGSWIKEHVLDPLKKAFRGDGDETEFVVETDVREKNPGVIEAVKSAWETIKTKTAKLTASIKDNTGKALKTLKSAWTTIKEKTSTLTTKIKDKTGTTLAILKSAWKTIKTKTATLTSKLANKVKEKTRKYLVGVWGSLYTKTASLVAKLKTSGAFDWIKNIWSSVYSKTVTLAVNFTSWVASGWNTLAKKWNNLRSAHPKLLAGTPYLPYLAQGAVIPANKEFLAVLGDQKSGINIETPLQTMIDAFNTALKANGMGGSQNINVYLQGDAKQIFKVVRVEANNYTQATGKAAFNI